MPHNAFHIVKKKDDPGMLSPKDPGSQGFPGSPIDRGEYGGVGQRMGALGRRKAEGVGASEWGAARGARDLLGAAARGEAPSAAESMFQRGTETAQRGAMAGMATGRGGAGLMQMGAVQGQGQAVMGAAGQAAQMRAQEMAQARGQYMQGATAMGQLGLGQAEQTNRMRMAIDQQMTSLMQSGMSRDAALQTAQNQAYMNERQLSTDRYLGQMDDTRQRAIAKAEMMDYDPVTGEPRGKPGMVQRVKEFVLGSAPFGSGEKKYEEAPYRIGTPEFKSKYPEEKAAALHGDVLPKLSSEISKGRKHPTLGETREHQGRDFGVPQGTSLIAPFDGTVSRVGNIEGGPGRYIAIKKKGDSREIKIFHLSKINIGAGTKVKKGKTILGLSGGAPGTVGAGESTGPHTHVEMWDRAEKESREIYPPLADDYAGTFVPGKNKGVLLDVMDMPGVIPQEAARQEKVAQTKKSEATSVESAPFEHIGPNPWVSRDIPMRELRRGKEQSDLIAAQEQALGQWPGVPPNTDGSSRERAKSFNEELAAKRAEIKSGDRSYTLRAPLESMGTSPIRSREYDMSELTDRRKGEWPSQYEERTGLPSYTADATEWAKGPDDSPDDLSGFDWLTGPYAPKKDPPPKDESAGKALLRQHEEGRAKANLDLPPNASASTETDYWDLSPEERKGKFEQLGVTGQRIDSLGYGSEEDPWIDIKKSLSSKDALETGKGVAGLFGEGAEREAGGRALGAKAGAFAGGKAAAAINPELEPLGEMAGSAIGSKIGETLFEEKPSYEKYYKDDDEGPRKRKTQRIALSAPYGSLSGYYSRMRGQ